MLLFIPNEQVYAFVQEHDPGLLDDALRHKVVCCSPLTLFAVLAVVRQSVDNFRLERTSGEIVHLLADFSAQWERYVGQLDTVQKRFESVAREYETLMTTRQRALQRPLDDIERLRRAELTLVDDGERAGSVSPQAATTRR
jgi:DNA recombination protein RmuC